MTNYKRHCIQYPDYWVESTSKLRIWFTPQKIVNRPGWYKGICSSIDGKEEIFEYQINDEMSEMYINETLYSIEMPETKTSQDSRDYTSLILRAPDTKELIFCYEKRN